MIRVFWVLIILLFSFPGFAQTQGNSSDGQAKVSQSTSTSGEANKVAAPAANGNGTAAAAAANSNNAVLSNITGGQSGWRFQGSMSHLPAQRNDQETVSDLLLRADYTFNKKHRVRVQQYYTKFYGTYESEYQFKPTDTLLNHYYSLGWKPYGANLLWVNSLTVPISHESARDDLFTRYTSSMIATKAFMGGKFMVFGVPYARYHFYEFKTSPSGNPLPWYTVGLSLTGLYFITDDLSVSVSGDYNFEGTRSSQFDSRQKNLFSRQLNQGLYSFDVWLSYQVTSALSASAFFTQGASYMQSGRYELVFYDNENSRFGANLTYIY